MEGQLREVIFDHKSGFEYLGLHFRTDLEIVHPADHLLDKLHQDLGARMRKILVTLRELQSFLGLTVMSATGSLPLHGQFNGGVGGVPKWERRQRHLERILEISPL